MLVAKQLVEWKKIYSMEVNGYRQLFDYQHFSKYLLLYLKEDIWVKKWKYLMLNISLI